MTAGVFREFDNWRLCAERAMTVDARRIEVTKVTKVDVSDETVVTCLA